jgi:hypothetical protein
MQSELLLPKGRSFLLRRDSLLEGLKALLVEVVLSTGVNTRSSCDIYSNLKGVSRLGYRPDMLCPY